MAALKAGLAKIDITPPIGTLMGGYRNRQVGGEGVHDLLYSKALVLENGNNSNLAIVTSDLLGINRKSVDKIREKIIKRISIDRDNILICASHTHSGPDVLSLFSKRVDKRYLYELENKMIEVVCSAWGAREKARVGIGKTEVEGVAYNRRLILKDGSVAHNFTNINEDMVEKRGPVDRTVGILNPNYALTGKRF